MGSRSFAYSCDFSRGGSKVSHSCEYGTDVERDGDRYELGGGTGGNSDGSGSIRQKGLAESGASSIALGKVGALLVDKSTCGAVGASFSSSAKASSSSECLLLAIASFSEASAARSHFKLCMQ